ncbi:MULTISPECIES: hypothetical protein [Idiomarina]|jgi:hypothetical protein|uniref:hypothetical protein n=1 Tax=Idiomarina TaxID=135575 RepID=UPI00241E8984|nr:MULTISPECIES: hypothetical protein [Idiomarina]|tara:strand:- start:1492 stop:1770 length:279 start_codon:yes stop_codon:yes gene_type:complete
MNEMKEIILDWALLVNLVAIIVILATKYLSNTKGSWAGVGCLLIVIALGNAISLVSAGVNPSEHIASLFGLAVLGSLGVTFVGSWLTADAQT